MYYKKIKSHDTVIEFDNNWLGEETVSVKGQVLSKKSSIWGTHHNFSVIEKGKEVRFVLTTKVNANLEVFLDLRRNGKLVEEDVPVMMGYKPKEPLNKAKQTGLQKLKEYRLEEAVVDLNQALEFDSEDPEIYFHLACAYSVLERSWEGFKCLKKAVSLGLPNQNQILEHDMLAFLRLHDAFEGFEASGFTKHAVAKNVKHSKDNHESD